MKNFVGTSVYTDKKYYDPYWLKENKSCKEQHLRNVMDQLYDLDGVKHINYQRDQYFRKFKKRKCSVASVLGDGFFAHLQGQYRPDVSDVMLCSLKCVDFCYFSSLSDSGRLQRAGAVGQADS